MHVLGQTGRCIESAWKSSHAQQMTGKHVIMSAHLSASRSYRCSLTYQQALRHSLAGSSWCHAPAPVAAMLLGLRCLRAPRQTDRVEAALQRAVRARHRERVGRASAVLEWRGRSATLLFEGACPGRLKAWSHSSAVFTFCRRLARCGRVGAVSVPPDVLSGCGGRGSCNSPAGRVFVSAL